MVVSGTDSLSLFRVDRVDWVAARDLAPHKEATSDSKNVFLGR